jgi:hypothetical protein
MVFIPPSIAVQETNAGLIYNYFSPPSGMGKIGAIALVAMASAESAFDPTALGDKDTAYGLWQLHEERTSLICNGGQGYKGCGIDVKARVLAGNAGVMEQCQAIDWELAHSEHTAKAAILAATSVYDAAVAATTKYMRPGAPGQPAARALTAAKWAAFFGVVA